MTRRSWVGMGVALGLTSALVGCGGSAGNPSGSSPAGSTSPSPTVALATASSVSVSPDPNASATARPSAPAMSGAVRSATTGQYISTVWVIVLENTDWSTVKQNMASSMPYLSSLMPQAAQAGRYYSRNHPSLPNYITLESGSNQGLTSGSYLPGSHPVSARHLTTLLNAAGYGWKYWAENLPGNGTTCNLSDPGFPYSEDHNPFVYFKDVKDDPHYCIAHERPMSEFAASLKSPPAYNFVVPNDMDQGEKCTDGTTHCSVGKRLTRVDGFLKSTVPGILKSTAYRHGAVFLVWDENGGSDPNKVTCGFVLLSPYARHGYTSNVTLDHGSTVRTVEELFGLTPYLGSAATSTDLSSLFTIPLRASHSG